MADRIAKGVWVEIRRTLLEPGERAPQAPEDTRAVPYEMRARGFLAAAAAPGEEAEIVTRAGRRLRGALVEANPPYGHGFGPPVPELIAIGDELRALLHDRGKAK